MPPAASSPLRSLWRVRHYVRPHAHRMAWLTLAAAAGTGLSLAVPLVVRRVVDGPIAAGDRAGLFRLGGLVLALGVCEAVLMFVRRWVQSGTTVSIESAIRNDLYAHLQRLPASFHDRWQSGQLLSRATTDLSVIRRLLSFGVVFGIVNLATFLTVTGLLLHLYWPLGLLVAAGSVPLVLASRRFARYYLVASRRLQDQLGDLATVVEEAAHGIRTTRAFGRGRHLGERFADGAGLVHDTAVRKARLMARSWAQFDLVPNATLAIVLVVGAVAVSRGRLTLGDLVAFVTLQLMLIWPVESLGWILANAQEAMTAAARVYEVLDTPPTIVDRPRAASAAAVRGHLRLERVGFTYPGASTPVLREVDLEVRPGETLALVGATGSGKTTLTALVPRLYDVTTGRVTLDGRDVRDYRLADLRRQVGTAFEEPTLFSISVRENLTLGRPEATDEEVRTALAIAQAEFVHDLPWGLATRVGEQGLSLSGGQRQRLALARAVLGRPAVLVLDDPLSALDVHTEALVEQALARVLRGTTALLVVHRPSTVALADRVALLVDGRIAATGTHSHLMATEPAYRAVLSAAADPEPEPPDRRPVPPVGGAAGDEVAAR